MEQQQLPNHLNLQGILKFALTQATKDEAESCTIPNLDVEKHIFFENALSEMTVREPEELEKAIMILENVSSVEMDKVHALTIIREHVDDIDFANSFINMGGSNILLNCLKSKESQVHLKAMHILAELSENNPYCQKHFNDLQIFPLIVSKFNDDDESIAATAVHAVSSLVRNFEPGMVEFIRMGGINSILSCLNKKDSRIFTKACFLIDNLSATYSSVRDEFIKGGATETIAAQLKTVSGFDVNIEACLKTLLELSKSEEFKLEKKTHNNIECILNNIIEENKQLSECEETVAYAHGVLKNIALR